MQQEYREPEYKVRATWGLAWGLLWRMWLICVPFYAAAAIFGALGK